MPRIISNSAFAHLPAAIVSASLVLGLAAFASPAAARGIREVTLATADQALTYCQSGKMPAGDIAYITGGPGLVQYGPDQNCAQEVASSGKITKAIQAGKRVSECKLASATKALQFCNSGAMGEWNIDYILGKVGKTISGPGYGCTVNYSTSSIGTAICK